MMIEEKVYLSIGSNIGDRESNIASSIAMLGSYIEISKIKSSSFYETEPLYNEDQPAFLNIVLEIETSLTPFKLLDKIREIEKMLGREEKRLKNQPGALLRNFVLIPLAELIPNEFFPKTNVKIVDLLKKCPDTSVVQKYIIDKKA